MMVFDECQLAMISWTAPLILIPALRMIAQSSRNGGFAGLPLVGLDH
jgi:hypothetical protein